METFCFSSQDADMLEIYSEYERKKELINWYFHF